MDKNFSIQDAMKMANTETGKKLLNTLQKGNADALAQAMQQAKQGDYSELQKTLAPMLASAEVQKLLKQMGGK